MNTGPGLDCVEKEQVWDFDNGVALNPRSGGMQTMIRGLHTCFLGAVSYCITRRHDLLLVHKYPGGQAEARRLRYLPCTDDGSHGFSDFTTQQLEAPLEEDQFDYICACGPEPMMVKVTDMCSDASVQSEASLERYMKCAIGICDACTVGDGLRLCVAGPVLSSEVLASVPEYVVGHRHASGVMHPW